MRPCKHCLNNKWSFEALDNGYIRATCRFCSKTVEWFNWKQERARRAIAVKLLRKKTKVCAKVYAPFKPYFSDEEIRNQPGPPPWDPPWEKR